MTTGDTLALRLQTLEALEHRHDLFTYRFDGWSAWRVMRSPVRRLAMALPLAAPLRSNARRSMQAFAASARLIWLLICPNRSELLVKTCRSGLRMPLGKQFRDVYFDGLLQHGYSCLKLEEINTPEFELQAAAAFWPSDLDPVVFTFWGRVLGLLFPVKALPFCKFVSNVLANEAQIEIAPKWLQMRLSTVYWQVRIYSLLLARVQAKVVLVSDTGEYALRIASARRAARFIELQHGVFDNTHPDAIPAWVAGSATELILPDILACRGQYWIEQLAKTRQGQGFTAAVGNELIDHARQRRHLRPKDGNYHIVLTTQGLDSARLSRWIVEMIAKAPATRIWRLSIKLHPVYDMNTRDFDLLKADPRVSIIGGAEQPNVFDLLADADLHLSIASACHFDAVALGLPSVVLPLAGHEEMLHAIDEIHIFAADTPARVWSIAPITPASPEAMNRFAAPGFVDNLQSLLASIDCPNHQTSHSQKHDSYP